RTRIVSLICRKGIYQTTQGGIRGRSRGHDRGRQMQMRAIACLVALLGVLAIAPLAGAQETAPDASEAPAGAGTQDTPGGVAAGFPRRELIIGTKEAPPFALKHADGTWTGISIELWRDIAQ